VSPVGPVPAGAASEGPGGLSPGSARRYSGTMLPPELRSPRALVAWLWSPTGRIAVRYSVVSAISVGITQAVLFLTFGVARLASAVVCNVLASAVAAGPSYYLNRRWAWGKTGRSHVWKEVVPFWALAFVGLALSVGAVDLAAEAGRGLELSHLGVAVLVNAASLLAFGVVWVGKFVVFHKVLFVDRPEPAPLRVVLASALSRSGSRRTGLRRSA
jgi:putative flippase GtrA